MVKIEKMSEKHIAQVAEIEESIFSVPWSQKAFKDSLELDNTAFYVAIEEEGVKDAKSEQIKEIMLEVRESNEAAIFLYEKIGFQSITKRKKYYKHPVEDAIIMLLKI